MTLETKKRVRNRHPEKIICSECKGERIVFILSEPTESYQKRRPTCRKCGQKNRLKKLGGHSNRWKGGEHLDKKGYVRVWVDKKTKYKMKHRVIWEKYNGKIPSEYVIHHIDGNKQNNDIENLQCMSKQDHDRINPSIRNAQKYRLKIRGEKK